LEQKELEVKRGNHTWTRDLSILNQAL